MYTNHHQIIINSNLKNVWDTLTNSDDLSKYLKNMKVETDWAVGSPIVYSHYEADGTITKWNDIEMIWNGIIETLEPNKQFDTAYLDGSGGLVKESYILEELSPNETKLDFYQEAISKELAENYKEGNEFALVALKNYIETKIV